MVGEPVSSNASVKKWVLLILMLWVAVLITSYIVLGKMGERGSIAYGFVKTNSSPRQMTALLNIVNQANLRDYILSQANLGSEVSFFIVENMKSHDRMRFSIRFSRKVKDHFEEKVQQIVDGYNELEVSKNIYNEALDKAHSDLQLAHEIYNKKTNINMIVNSEDLYIQSPNLAQKKYDEIKGMQKLFVTEQIIVSSGGKNLKIYLQLSVVFVILLGLSAMILQRKS